MCPPNHKRVGDNSKTEAKNSSVAKPDHQRRPPTPCPLHRVRRQMAAPTRKDTASPASTTTKLATVGCLTRLNTKCFAAVIGGAGTIWKYVCINQSSGGAISGFPESIRL